MQVTAFGIACLAVVLSVASLLWQWWTWRSNGPRIDVSVRVTVVVGIPYYTVVATNRGRGAATIFSWAIQDPISGEDLHALTQYDWDDALPTRLEPHSTASYSIGIPDMVDRLGLERRELKPFIKYADKTIYGKSKWPLPITGATAKTTT